LCIVNHDYTIHQYRAHRDKIGERKIDSLMEVELKTWQSDLSYAQRDTWEIKAALHKETCCRKDGRTRTFRLEVSGQIRVVRPYGYFRLRLERQRPDDGGWIEWSGRVVDTDTLVDILRFEIDPRTLTRRRKNERRSHIPSLRQQHPDLFAVIHSAA
jgi:hypothetical protein